MHRAICSKQEQIGCTVWLIVHSVKVIDSYDFYVEVMVLMSRIQAVLGHLAIVCAASLSSAANAQETTTYTYDALGRLTKVERSGGASNGVTTTYAYDKANNRANVTTTGSTNGTGSGGGPTTPSQSFVVALLGGYPLIFYSNGTP